MRFLARPLVLGGIMLLLLLGATGSVVGRAGPARDVRAVAARAVAGRAVARSPLAFQPEGASRFVARTPGHGVAVSPDGATLSGVGGRAPLQLHLVGANPDAAAEGRGLLAGRASQFLGDDPSTWRTDVATYGEVAYAGVWRGVDVVWHGRGSNLEQDFVVAPGGDADRIRLSFPGARSLRIVDGGALVVTLADSEARFGAPTLYQDERGGRRDVAGGFIVRPGGTIGFRVGTHDVDRPVVIDPVLVESTFLGGGGNDAAFGVAVDAAGSVYVTGSTESVDFPVAGSVQSSLVQVGDVRLDAFVTKLKPDGSAFVYSTFLGGRGRDVGYAIAVAADGSATVSGSTESTDFPLARPVQKAYGGGATDAFVTRLSPQGAVLQFSTYLGGGGADLSRGVAVDASGRATLVGTTNSNDFPTAGPPLQGAPNHPDDIAAFVTRLDADGSAWVYSTYVGGSGDDRATAVAVDAAGDAYVTGETQSPDFPTVRPLQASPGSPPGAGAASADAFAIKLAPAGSPLLFATYLGGSAVDRATGVAVDPAGAAYVTGSTGSSNFPSVRALQPTSGGGDDAFVAKIDPAGTSLVWSTFLGGSAADAGAAIAVTADGRASVTGASSSGNFPTAKPVRRAKGGFLDAFVATFAPSGGTLSESTYLGGSDDDHGTAIASDRSGTLYLAGYTTSADFPLVSPIRTTMGRSDAFLASVGEPPAATSSGGAAAPARERRIRLLGAATVVLFLAAIAQTLWLRHRGTPAAPDPATSVPPLGVVPTPQADPQWYAPAPPRLSDLPPLRPRALPPPAPRRGRKASSAVAQKSAGPDEPRGDVAVPDLFPAGEDDNWSREGQPDDTEFWSTDGAFREADDDHRPPLSVDVQAPDLWGADEIEVTNVVDDAVVAGAGSPPATVDVSAPDLWGPAEPEQETTIDPMWAELLAKPGTAAPPTAQPAASPPPATPPEAAPPIEPTPAAATPPEATSGEVVDAPASPPPKQKPKRRTRPRPEPAPAAAPVPSEPVGGEQPPVASGDWMAELWPVASPEAEEAVAVPGDAPAAEAAAPAGADEVESESPPAAPVEEVRRGWRARRRAAADRGDRRPPPPRERSPSPPPVSS
ncbi:MAG: SBBP repeat-containing protein, partial [Acidimicrobiales bacterium]